MRPIPDGGAEDFKVYQQDKVLHPGTVAIQDVFSVDEAHNKTMKIERLQGRALPFKGVAERISGNTRA